MPRHDVLHWLCAAIDPNLPVTRTQRRRSTALVPAIRAGRNERREQGHKANFAIAPGDTQKSGFCPRGRSRGTAGPRSARMARRRNRAAPAATAAQPPRPCTRRSRCRAAAAAPGSADVSMPCDASTRPTWSITTVTGRSARTGAISSIRPDSMWIWTCIPRSASRGARDRSRSACAPGARWACG